MPRTRTTRGRGRNELPREGQNARGDETDAGDETAGQSRGGASCDLAGVSWMTPELYLKIKEMEAEREREQRKRELLALDREIAELKSALVPSSNASGSGSEQVPRKSSDEVDMFAKKAQEVTEKTPEDEGHVFLRCHTVQSEFELTRDTCRNLRTWNDGREHLNGVGLEPRAPAKSELEAKVEKSRFGQNRVGYRGSIAEDENSDEEAREPEEERSEREGSEQSEGFASGSDAEGEGSDRPDQSEAEVEGLDRQDESDANQKTPVEIDVSDQQKRNDNAPVHQDMSDVERSVRQGISDAEREDQQEENETEQSGDEVEEGDDHQSGHHSERSAPSSSPRGSDNEVTEREKKSGSESDRKKIKQIEQNKDSQRGSDSEDDIGLRRKKKQTEESEGFNRGSDGDKKMLLRKRTRKKRAKESEGSQKGLGSDEEPLPRKEKAAAEGVDGENEELDGAEKQDVKTPDLEDKEVPQDESVAEKRTEVEIPRSLTLTNLGKDVPYVELPNFLSVGTRPRDPQWYEDEVLCVSTKRECWWRDSRQLTVTFCASGGACGDDTGLLASPVIVLKGGVVRFVRFLRENPLLPPDPIRFRLDIKSIVAPPPPL